MYIQLSKKDKCIMLVALLFTHNGAVIDTEQNFIKQYNHVCPMHQ